MKGQGKNDYDPASERSRQNGVGKFVQSKVRTAPPPAPPSVRQGSEGGLAPPAGATAAATIPLSSAAATAPAAPVAAASAHLTEKDVQSELDRILQTLQLLKERNLVKPATSAGAPGTNSVRRKWTAIQQVLQGCDNNKTMSLKDLPCNGQIVRSRADTEDPPDKLAGNKQKRESGESNKLIIFKVKELILG